MKALLWYYKNISRQSAWEFIFLFGGRRMHAHIQILCVYDWLGRRAIDKSARDGDNKGTNMGINKSTPPDKHLCARGYIILWFLSLTFKKAPRLRQGKILHFWFSRCYFLGFCGPGRNMTPYLATLMTLFSAIWIIQRSKISIKKNTFCPRVIHVFLLLYFQRKQYWRLVTNFICDAHRFNEFSGRVN